MSSSSHRPRSQILGARNRPHSHKTSTTNKQYHDDIESPPTPPSDPSNTLTYTQSHHTFTTWQTQHPAAAQADSATAEEEETEAVAVDADVDDEAATRPRRRNGSQ